MKIYLASDHAGFRLKADLMTYLSEKGYEVDDMGNAVYDETDDYPDFIFPLAEKVAQEKDVFGIVIGKSGNGEAIVANKIKGVRAALCLSVDMAKLAREHNNANILVLGADFIQNSAEDITGVFIETSFSEEERHRRRIEKISSFEQKG